MSLNLFSEVEITSINGFSTYNILLHYSPPPSYRSFQEEKRLISLLVSRSILNYVYSLVNTLSKGKMHSVYSYIDEDYGIVVKVITELTAKEALELWLKIIEHLKLAKYNAVVAVEWLGERNVSEDELIDYMVKVMMKSGVGPKALPGFDAVKMVREEREG